MINKLKYFYYIGDADVKKQKYMFNVDSLLQFCAKIYAQNNLTVKIMCVRNVAMLVIVSHVKRTVLKVCICVFF